MKDKVTFYENGKVVRELAYDITEDCITIIKGWNLPKREYGYVLDCIEKAHPTCKVFNRKRASLKLEWACHSFLYQMQIARERTKDIDLDKDADHKAWLYCICGCLIWFFA